MNARLAGRFAWAGADLSLSLPDRRWLDRLSDLLGLEADIIPGEPTEIRVHDATHLRSYETELGFATPHDLLVWLTLTIVDVLAEKAKAFLIHAASLRIGGGMVLLSGPPYSGKSTLSLHARARGMALLGDDVVRLHLDTLHASPVPRPLRERVLRAAPGGDPLACGTSLEGALDGETCRLHARATAPSLLDNDVLPISAVYFLRRHTGPGLIFTQPDTFAALQMFLDHARVWSPQNIALLPRIAALLKQSDCAVLSVGDGEMDAALAAIEQRRS